MTSPDLWATMLEELQELGDEHIKRPVQSISVQCLCRVLADLLQRTKSTLK